MMLMMMMMMMMMMMAVRLSQPFRAPEMPEFPLRFHQQHREKTQTQDSRSCDLAASPTKASHNHEKYHHGQNSDVEAMAEEKLGSHRKLFAAASQIARRNVA